MIAKKDIIETIRGCTDIINYLSSTDSVSFKTYNGETISKDDKLIQFLLRYFRDIRNKFESKL